MLSVFLCSILYLFMSRELQYHVKVTEVPGASPLNVTQAMVITRNPQRSAQKIESMRRKTGFETVELHPALVKVNLTELPLYTRYVLETGRHDVYQVGSPAMVGKYFSHVDVWRKMQEGDIFAVFEEDAHFSDAARNQLALLDRFIRLNGLSFSVLMLGIDRNPEPMGKVKIFDVGGGLRLAHCLSACSIRGTRGYVITYEGARLLLKKVEPVEIQIDGLLSLMARYDKDFQLFWTQTDLALGPSVLEQLNDAVGQDSCFKCHLPTSNVYYIGFWVVLGACWLALCLCKDCCAFPGATRLRPPRCLHDGALQKRIAAWKWALFSRTGVPVAPAPAAGGAPGGAPLGPARCEEEFKFEPIREDPLQEEGALCEDSDAP
jgi:hypothetical protein